MWFNFCQRFRQPSTFDAYLKGKKHMQAPQQAALKDLVKQTDLTARELFVLSADEPVHGAAYVRVAAGELVELSLDGVVLQDASFLQELPALRQLRLRPAQLRSLPDLAHLQQLETLSLPVNALRELELPPFPG